VRGNVTNGNNGNGIHAAGFANRIEENESNSNVLNGIRVDETEKSE